MKFTAFIDLGDNYKVLDTFDNHDDAAECAVNTKNEFPGVPGVCEHPDDVDALDHIKSIMEDDDLERLTEFLDDIDKWACEYCTGNTDYATGYDCLVTEDQIRWRDRVREWVADNYPHLSKEFADRVWENIDGGFDSEWEYHSNEYASYSGSGCCIGQFEIGEHEEQITIEDHKLLQELHEKDVLDDLLDDYKGELYVNRSRPRVKNEETGRYEYVGRETYKCDRGWHHFYGYSMPGGQWMAVVPKERMHEIVTETIIQTCER